MVILYLLMDDKDKKSCFFEKTFLLAKISMDVALRMSFLTLNNVEVNFIILEYNSRLYTIAEVFLTTR